MPVLLLPIRVLQGPAGDYLDVTDLHAVLVDVPENGVVALVDLVDVEVARMLAKGREDAILDGIRLARVGIHHGNLAFPFWVLS